MPPTSSSITRSNTHCLAQQHCCRHWQGQGQAVWREVLVMHTATGRASGQAPATCPGQCLLLSHPGRRRPLSSCRVRVERKEKGWGKSLPGPAGHLQGL